MCGIAGYFSIRPLAIEKIGLLKSLMHHRGPDANGMLDFVGDRTKCLFHSRLSIIDLDKRANQPYSLGPFTLAYNGEIYNYLELRRELSNEGIIFETESDTEVVLRSFIHYGQNCVSRFEGMWSFAIFDSRDNSLFLSRDRFGEKPLFYHAQNDTFLFASEIKFVELLLNFTLEINYSQIRRYLVNGFRSLEKHKETFFMGIQKVPSGTNLTISDEYNLKFQKYWAPVSTPDQNMTLSEAVAGFRVRLEKSLELRLRADVPLAFCLSGGVDSSALVSIASKKFNYPVSAFSIVDQDSRYDESDNIQETVRDLGCPHTMITLSPAGFMDRLRTLIFSHDGPLATISYYVHAFLSEAIAAHGYKVAVSGTGADELITGYYDHGLLQLYELRDHPDRARYVEDWCKYIRPFIRNPHLENPNLYVANPTFREHIYLNSHLFAQCLHEDFNEEFIENHYCESLLRNRMLNELFEEIVPVILHEDDLNSMMFSLENRSPYLDTDLFNFSSQIPPEHLIVNGYTKFVLREAVRGVLNDKVRLTREKRGFNASLSSLVNFNDPQTRATLLSDGPIFQIVKRGAIERFFELTPLPNSISKFLFNFINVKMFLENRMEQRSAQLPSHIIK